MSQFAVYECIESGCMEDVEIKTTRNIPKNIKEEAETAQALEGLVSKDTQLGVLSIVSNVSKEIEKMESESNANRTDEELKRLFGVGGNGSGQ
jgi:hypothetical protein